jgi:hypothetical protein
MVVFPPIFSVLHSTRDNGDATGFIAGGGLADAFHFSIEDLAKPFRGSPQVRPPFKTPALFPHLEGEDFGELSRAAVPSRCLKITARPKEIVLRNRRP